MSDEALLDEVRALREEIRHLPEAIAAAMAVVRTPQRDLGEDEERDLTTLARGITAAIGDRAFLAAELVAHSRLDPALQGTLDTAGCGSDCRKLGKRLQRAEGHPLQGHKVERVRTERGGALWRIVAISRVSLPLYSRSSP
jgi:hypothetical protein